MLCIELRELELMIVVCNFSSEWGGEDVGDNDDLEVAGVSELPVKQEQAQSASALSDPPPSSPETTATPCTIQRKS